MFKNMMNSRCFGYEGNDLNSSTTKGTKEKKYFVNTGEEYCPKVEAYNLQVSESALTGEAQSVGKFADTVLEKDSVVSDRVNMVFSGCYATYGRGVFVVTEIGMQTEIGKIPK